MALLNGAGKTFSRRAFPCMQHVSVLALQMARTSFHHIFPVGNAPRVVGADFEPSGELQHRRTALSGLGRSGSVQPAVL
jgi:hypothetical protein